MMVSSGILMVSSGTIMVSDGILIVSNGFRLSSGKVANAFPMAKFHIATILDRQP